MLPLMSKTTKPKSWATLLQQELTKPSEKFTPEHKTFREICAELKAAGLPFGNNYVYQVLRQLIASGKASCTEDHSAIGINGRRNRCVKYLIK